MVIIIVLTSNIQRERYQKYGAVIKTLKLIMNANSLRIYQMKSLRIERTFTEA